MLADFVLAEYDLILREAAVEKQIVHQLGKCAVVVVIASVIHEYKGKIA